VAGWCECGDELSGSGATELVNYDNKEDTRIILKWTSMNW
jgi:hypothetical protein